VKSADRKHAGGLSRANLAFIGNTHPKILSLLLTLFVPR